MITIDARELWLLLPWYLKLALVLQVVLFLAGIGALGYSLYLLHLNHWNVIWNVPKPCGS